MTATIAAILRALAGAVAMPELAGLKAAKLAPIINTAAAFAELPVALEPERQALLEVVQRWIDEKREPTDEELDAWKNQRDELDAKLRELRTKTEDVAP